MLLASQNIEDFTLPGRSKQLLLVRWGMDLQQIPLVALLIPLQPDCYRVYPQLYETGAKEGFRCAAGQPEHRRFQYGRPAVDPRLP